MGGPETRLGFLFLLLIGWFTGTPSDAHSLCYNFTVNPHPSPGEPWCVVQGQVDGNAFLSYDCGGTMIHSTSPLGEEVKTTNTWETQRQTLRDIGDFLKGQLPDFIPEKHTSRGVQWKERALEERTGPDYRGPGEVDMVRQRIRQVRSLSSFFSLVGSDHLTVQGRMTCWCEEDGRISGSWQFGFSGEMCLRFDSEDGHWTVDHSGGRRIKEKWEKDRAVTDFFKKVSMGDCRAWLREFMVHWEKMLKTPASPTTVPATVQPTDPASNHITEIILVVLAVFVIISIVAWILFKKRTWCSQEAQQVLCWPEDSFSAWPPLLSCVHFRAKRLDLRNPKSVYQL